MPDMFGEEQESMETKFDFKCAGNRNRGFRYDRTRWNDLEKSFADHWELENKKSPGINFGNGLLQDLFFGGSAMGEFSVHCVHWVTPMERFVAATAIQWLGTNCGFGFLQQALRTCNMRIVMSDTGRPSPLPEGSPNPYSRKFA